MMNKIKHIKNTYHGKDNSTSKKHDSSLSIKGVVIETTIKPNISKPKSHLPSRLSF